MFGSVGEIEWSLGMNLRLLLIDPSGTVPEAGDTEVCRELFKLFGHR